MKSFFIFFLSLISLSVIAQSEINQTDSQGRKQGVWKKPYEQSKVFRYVGQFKDDVPYGKFIYYYETGEVEAVVHFFEKGKVTRSQLYHRSGYMMAKGKYVNQQKDSIWVYYDDRGLISYQETYKGGKLNGQKVYFYQPRDNKLYIARYEYYRDGILHGEFKEFHQNTEVKAEGRYVDGNLDGKVMYYHPNGRIKKILHYKHAVQHGLNSFYNEKGELVGTTMYWNGRLVEDKDEAEEKKKIWLEQRKGE